MLEAIGGLFVMLSIFAILVGIAALLIFLFNKFDEAQSKHYWVRNMVASPFLWYYRKKIQLCGQYGFGVYEYKRKEAKLLSYIINGIQ